MEKTHTDTEKRMRLCIVMCLPSEDECGGTECVSVCASAGHKPTTKLTSSLHSISKLERSIVKQQTEKKKKKKRRKTLKAPDVNLLIQSAVTVMYSPVTVSLTFPLFSPLLSFFPSLCLSTSLCTLSLTLPYPLTLSSSTLPLACS